MSHSTATTTPELAPHGMPCAGCGAPLARDQRYCLSCGARRGDARVDYLRYLAPAPGPDGSLPAAAQSAAATTERPPRDFAPLAAAGGVVVLGLMLLVGVLIGRGDEQAPTAAAPPQVLTVSGDGTVTADKEAAKPAETGSRGDGAKEGGKSGGENGKGEDLTASGGAGESTDDPVEASTEDLEALESASPEDYAEQSANLPDTIATPGEPPPKDNVAPGGGSDGTTIK